MIGYTETSSEYELYSYIPNMLYKLFERIIIYNTKNKMTSYTDVIISDVDGGRIVEWTDGLYDGCGN